MGLSAVTYALSKKYTDETAAQFGALKGASCQIKSINKSDGVTTITFVWENSEGETRESQAIIVDGAKGDKGDTGEQGPKGDKGDTGEQGPKGDPGTPIYQWIAGTEYAVKDLVIYNNCFFYCTIANSDLVFDETKWSAIGSSDGNYDIVQKSSLLPSDFTSVDRKIYYSIEDNFFWLWDGSHWMPQKTVIQYDILPTAEINYLGKVVQYIGETNNNYKKGYFYICQEDEEHPGIYKWESSIEEVQELTDIQINNLINMI